MLHSLSVAQRQVAVSQGLPHLEGARPSAQASSMASLRTGRLASNTTTSSKAVTARPSPPRLALLSPATTWVAIPTWCSAA
jgi:hypothetical protein